MAITVNSGRALYDGGQPLPGKVIRNDNGENILAGVVDADLPFGRLVGPFVLQADGETKLFSAMDENTTISDGISVYSFDAIAAQSDLKYSDKEPCGVIGRGNVIMESADDLALDNTALTVVNGTGTGDADNVGKVSQTTGAGHSSVTNMRLIRKISATLVEVQITGPVALVDLGA